MILLMINSIWQELAESGPGTQSPFGEMEIPTYNKGAAGFCVNLLFCSKVTLRYTLPFLRGLIVNQSGPFFFRRLFIQVRLRREYLADNEAVGFACSDAYPIQHIQPENRAHL